MFGNRRTGMKIELDQVKAQLQEVIKQRDEFAREATGLRNQIEYLVRTIRDMDEQIYKMSQATSMDQMRPNLLNLIEGMTVRKRQESDRIGDIVRGELIKTYATTPEQKRIAERK